ncbi:GIY-YIG nuclease family protein [Rhodovulum euryhalinum]|uniref:GIY-YIG nuclease family protein n=1 Tax=Rhodovulum euryhalinum TaxID=35805 RepID=UPI001404A343|nr:GIY-YIG nuclease family protein [Rhodovulum euryhalinum]
MAGLDPSDVSVILHTTNLRPLRRMLQYLAAERRDLFDAYQAVHSDQATSTLRGRELVATFLPFEEGRLLFEGVYGIAAAEERPTAEIYANPAYRELEEVFGATDTGPDRNVALRDRQVHFTLEPRDELADLRGRIVIPVPVGRTYVRIATRLEAHVLTILETPAFVPPPPAWDEFVIAGGLMRSLPRDWSERLRQWRGVYLIVDETDGARYVGSAYGADNLLGRWSDHVRGERGVTVELAARDPANFRFSILQLVSPTETAESVIALENNWKLRLHTRDHGLNQR